MTVSQQDLIDFTVMYATHDAVHAPTPAEADVDWTFGGLWPSERAANIARSGDAGWR
jgi:hypothetical protein